MDTSSILCVFLLSCFTEIKIPKGCPTDCECYEAPKDGYLWNQKSESLVCTEIPTKEQLKIFEHINVNTFALKGVYIHSLKDKYFESLYINNIVIDGGEQINKMNNSFRESTSPFNGISGSALRVLTLVNINVDSLDWKPLEAAQSLRAIHIEKCVLKSIGKAGLGSMSALKIISLTIIQSNLEVIDASAFKGWDSLKMLTINNNYLEDLKWISEKLPELWYLDLRGNYIEEIHESFFPSLPKLKVLKLDDNNIKTLNWNMLEPYLPNIKEFSLQDNILCATKDVQQFYKTFLKKSDFEYPNFLYYSLRSMNCKDVIHDAATELCIYLKDSSFGDDYKCQYYNRKKIPKSSRNLY